jgi:phage terminase large subunit-like protein
VLRSKARFRVLACGRRWGKSLLALMAALLAARRPNAVIWFVAPTFRMVDLHWRTLRRHLPQTYAGVLRQAERRLLCSNGAEIAFRSADNPDHLRGVGLDFLVVDEAAFVPDGATAWAEAMRPTLSDRRGQALIISTPRGHDWFHAMWLRGQEPEDPEVASFHFPSASNPLLAPEEIEAARRELPARICAQEFEARFLDDGGCVFRGVRDAVSGDAPGPYAGRFVVGVDWGKRDDFTVFVVLDAERGAVVAIERYNRLDYVLQLQRLSALCERWRPMLVHAEQNAMGDPLIEQVERAGLPVRGFKTTAGSKARVIEALALAFDQGALSLPRDAALLAELEAYTMEPGRGGSYRYSAPAGLHDDCVMALALAWDARGATSSEVLAEYF